jgi:hypothetical protein
MMLCNLKITICSWCCVIWITMYCDAVFSVYCHCQNVLCTQFSLLPVQFLVYFHFSKCFGLLLRSIFCILSKCVLLRSVLVYCWDQFIVKMCTQFIFIASSVFSLLLRSVFCILSAQFWLVSRCDLCYGKTQVYQEGEDLRCVLSFVSGLYMYSKVSGFSFSNVLCSFQFPRFSFLYIVSSVLYQFSHVRM